MFWTISNSFASLAILSVSSLYMVRLWNPFGGGVWGENQSWSGWVLWVPGAGKWPCHSGFLHPLPGPCDLRLCDSPISELSLHIRPTPTPNYFQLHVWFTDSDNGLPPPPPSCSMWRQSEPWPLDACLSLATRTAVSSNQNMLIPLR